MDRFCQRYFFVHSRSRAGQESTSTYSGEVLEEIRWKDLCKVFTLKDKFLSEPK
jgi:hypothetical protein